MLQDEQLWINTKMTQVYKTSVVSRTQLLEPSST